MLEERSARDSGSSTHCAHFRQGRFLTTFRRRYVSSRCVSRQHVARAEFEAPEVLQQSSCIPSTRPWKCSGTSAHACVSRSAISAFREFRVATGTARSLRQPPPPLCFCCRYASITCMHGSSMSRGPIREHAAKEGRGKIFTILAVTTLCTADVQPPVGGSRSCRHHDPGCKCAWSHCSLSDADLTRTWSRAASSASCLAVACRICRSKSAVCRAFAPSSQCLRFKLVCMKSECFSDCCGDVSST